MSREKVRGLAEANALFDRLPTAARHELADELGPIGRDILAAQRAVVAKKTGALGTGLKSAIDADRLKVRVGLVGLRQRRGLGASRLFQDLFYGRFVELGRAAQTVLVTRRLKRRVRGNGQNGRKRRVIYEGKPYPMKVAAMKARPFINPPGALAAAERRLADYWARVFARVGEG